MQTDRHTDRANPSSQYLDGPAQPISSEVGAQQLSIGHWSGLRLTALPLGRLEETGSHRRRRRRKGKGQIRWKRRHAVERGGVRGDKRKGEGGVRRQGQWKREKRKREFSVWSSSPPRWVQTHSGTVRSPDSAGPTGTPTWFLVCGAFSRPLVWSGVSLATGPMGVGWTHEGQSQQLPVITGLQAQGHAPQPLEAEGVCAGETLQTATSLKAAGPSASPCMEEGTRRPLLVEGKEDKRCQPVYADEL